MDIYSQQRQYAVELAVRLFLLPESVVNIVRYWLANHTDFTLDKVKEEDFFISLVNGLLEHPVRLEISGSEALATRHSTQVKYQTILQFIGTPYHRIPLAYFATCYDFQLSRLLSGLTSTDGNCFSQRVAPLLDGELQMSTMQFDLLLNEYYDPFFYVLVAFHQHMIALVNPAISGCLRKEDWLPRHFYSLRALSEESLDRINCFPRDSTGKRTEGLKNELRELYSILAVDDVHKAIEWCTGKFEERATQLFSSIPFSTI